MTAVDKGFGPQWNAKIKAIEAAMQKTSTGKPMMVVACEVLDGEHKGQVLQFRGLLNPENLDQTDRTIKAMECLGASNFRNDPFASNAIAGLGRTVARGLLAMDTDQNGVERMIVRFVNPDSLIREDAMASDADRNDWKKQFGGVIQAIKDKGADGEKPNF
jgi:hypothetical protein